MMFVNIINKCVIYSASFFYVFNLECHLEYLILYLIMALQGPVRINPQCFLLIHC